MKPKNTKQWITRVIAAIALAWPALSQGAVLITSINTTGLRDNTALAVGLQFTVGNQALSVTDLGAININNTGAIKSAGLAAATPVGLWDDSGNLLASVTLSAGAGGGGGGTLYAYGHLITPITLSANTTYRLAASFLENGSDYWYDEGAANVSSDVTSDKAAYSFPAQGLVFPNRLATSTNGYVGPNLLYTVPEPSTWAMLLLACGLTSVMVLRRRRQV